MSRGLRRDLVGVGSLVVLGLHDLRVPFLLVACGVLLYAVVRAMPATPSAYRRGLGAVALSGLFALFVWNKLGGSGGGVLPSQGGLVLLGISYLVLRMAAVVIDSARGALPAPSLRDLLAWISFAPIYPCGPIEELDHFRTQDPGLARVHVLEALERILFGLFKVFLLSHYLGTWADPVLGQPEAHPWLVRLLAVYAFTLRFYFDFSGYSDLAIGVSRLCGYEIQENFDHPLTRRNLVQLWRHWHMTLTRWLRSYLFIPLSRAVMRRAGARWDTPALIAAQLATMTFCGVWHGLGQGFALWGLLQGLGLVWVGIAARPAGALLPDAFVAWWRRSPLAYGLSAGLSFNAFAFMNLLVFSDVQGFLSLLDAVLIPH